MRTTIEVDGFKFGVFAIFALVGAMSRISARQSIRTGPPLLG